MACVEGEREKKHIITLLSLLISQDAIFLPASNRQLCLGAFQTLCSLGGGCSISLTASTLFPVGQSVTVKTETRGAGGESANYGAHTQDSVYIVEDGIHAELHYCSNVWTDLLLLSRQKCAPYYKTHPIFKQIS